MCPYCHSAFSRVIATERYDTVTRRRRRCLHCSGKFYSDEKYSGMIEPPPSLQLVETNGNLSLQFAAIDGNPTR
jgi:transcriptional regulator NrdR family protein